VAYVLLIDVFVGYGDSRMDLMSAVLTSDMMDKTPISVPVSDWNSNAFGGTHELT
jgi:hypothetical protein